MLSTTDPDPWTDSAGTHRARIQTNTPHPTEDHNMATSEHKARPAIAIVGVSALFPGSVDATGFWSDILAGTDRMTDVPASHWLIEDHYDSDMAAPDKTYGRRGGFL